MTLEEEAQACSDAASEAAHKGLTLEREAWTRAALAFAFARDLQANLKRACLEDKAAADVPATDITRGALAWERAARAHEGTSANGVAAWEMSGRKWRELAERHRADEEEHAKKAAKRGR